MQKKIKKVNGNNSVQGIFTNTEPTKNINDQYATQAISQPDKRQPKTGIAMPDEDNVERARNWVDENELS